jgi:hypothetical protein
MAEVPQPNINPYLDPENTAAKAQAASLLQGNRASPAARCNQLAYRRARKLIVLLFLGDWRGVLDSDGLCPPTVCP